MKTYKIKARTDREGNLKETPTEWLDKQYELTRVEIGFRGFLNWVGYDNYGLDTSTIKSVEESENGEVTLVTHNTIYIFEPTV